MTLQGYRVTIVSRGTPLRRDVLRAAGAIVVAMDVNELAIGLDPTLDALVLEVGAAPETFGVFMAGISIAMRGRPVVALIDGGVAARRLASLGSVAVLDDETDDATLLARLEASIASSTSSDTARLEDAEDRARELSTRINTAIRASETLAHDVRVLCGVAMGYAANLRDGFAGPLEAAQREHVAQILSALTDVGGLFERASGTTAALAEEADSPPPSIRRVTARRTSSDLVDIVTATVRLFENVAAEKALALALVAPDPVRVWCDATQIKQAVTNLLVNALKFTPAGGRVTVSVGIAHPDGSGAVGVISRRNACVTVEDTGHGVAEADRERIFVRGFRADKHASVAGSGIGLAVVREVAVLHGGSVRVDEPASGGAAFVLTLPIDLRRRREAGMLLIDDAAAAARIVTALTDEGLESFEGVSGAERLRVLLAGCAAVVAVPRGRMAMLEAAAAAGVDAPPMSSRAPNSRRGGP